METLGLPLNGYKDNSITSIEMVSSVPANLSLSPSFTQEEYHYGSHVQEYNTSILYWRLQVIDLLYMFKFIY